MRTYPCRRGGTCLICGIKYEAGDMIARLPGGRGHAKCSEGAARIWTPVPSAPKAGRSICRMPTKTGEACQIDPGPDGFCHIHDPNGLYALQHPQYRARLFERMPAEMIPA